MTTSYAYEKISNAVSALAVGTGSIQERLLDAFMSMSALSRNDFTGQELDEWDSIFARATVRHDEEEGAYRATLLTMNQDEAVRLAQDIVNLEAMLSIS